MWKTKGTFDPSTFNSDIRIVALENRNFDFFIKKKFIFKFFSIFW